MTSKQRAYLKGLAMTMEPILQVGKSSITPEHTAAVAEALEARELIKINVLQNCLDDPREIAEVLAERTNSQVVQVIGKRSCCTKRAKREKENSASEIIRRKEPPGPEHTAAVPALFEENVWKRKQKNWHYGRHIRSHSYRSSDPWRGGVRAVRA